MIDTLKEPKTSRAPSDADGQRPDAVLNAFAGHDSGKWPAWLKTNRATAQARAAQLGFPHTRLEEWRFTNPASIFQLPLHPAERASATISREEIERLSFGLDTYRLVFVDGHFSLGLSSLPEKGNDLRAGNLQGELAANSSLLEKHLAKHAEIDANFFAAFNTAFFQDGAFVSIPAGKTADKPVHLLFIGQSAQPGATILPRNLIFAGRAASVKIIESHVSLSDASRVENTVTELVLEEGAQIEHCQLQLASERAFYVATIQGVQARNSQWTSHSIAIGSRLARNQIQTLFNGEGATAILNGLYMADGEQLIDHHTVVDHAKPHCESHEFYHGILGGRAHGVFNGKIFVRKDAQKTNAKQTNRNLLLSDTAVIDTKPQLEIFADDVKCTHGATVGQLNDEAVFYLQARGIGQEQARQMLIRAFAGGVVERISIEPLRAHLDEILAQRFQRGQK